MDQYWTKCLDQYWTNIGPNITKLGIFLTKSDQYWTNIGPFVLFCSEKFPASHRRAAIILSHHSPISLCTHPNPISVRRRGHSRLSTIAQRGGLVGGSFFLIFSNRFSFSHIYHTLLFFAPMLVLALIQERSCAQHTTLMRYIQSVAGIKKPRH